MTDAGKKSGDEALTPLEGSTGIAADGPSTVSPSAPDQVVGNSIEPASAEGETQPHRDQAGLDFTTDRGSSRSTWIAAIITLVVIGWMGSGFFLPAQEPELVAASSDVLPVTVAIRQSVAQQVTLFFNAEGQALPDRDTMIRPEASGEIAEVFVSMGEFVEEGAQIARIRSEQAEAELARAQQEVTRTERDLENAEALLERGVATLDRVQEARSAFAQADVQLTSAEEALADLVIVAPFAGRIETLDLDAGEFVQAGAEIARLVDISPLTVSFQVPQQALSRLESGQTARVFFITGEEREATVTFVGTSAAQSTRTFLAEVSLPNEDGAIAAGISAEISIPTEEVTAHFLSPSVVSLSPEGQLGVKTVDDENIVHFYPVEVVRPELDGIWVTGLPDEINVITVGQGYVSDGETVRPQIEEGS